MFLVEVIVFKFFVYFIAMFDKKNTLKRYFDIQSSNDIQIIKYQVITVKN